MRLALASSASSLDRNLLASCSMEASRVTSTVSVARSASLSRFTGMWMSSASAAHTGAARQAASAIPIHRRLIISFLFPLLIQNGFHTGLQPLPCASRTLVTARYRLQPLPLVTAPLLLCLDLGDPGSCFAQRRVCDAQGFEQLLFGPQPFHRAFVLLHRTDVLLIDHASGKQHDGGQCRRPAQGAKRESFARDVRPEPRVPGLRGAGIEFGHASQHIFREIGWRLAARHGVCQLLFQALHFGGLTCPSASRAVVSLLFKSVHTSPSPFAIRCGWSFLAVLARSRSKARARFVFTVLTFMFSSLEISSGSSPS